MNYAGTVIPDEIDGHIKLAVETLLSKFSSNIIKIILFGSFATGKYQPDSDIDIAVVLSELPDIYSWRDYTQAADIGGRELDLLFCTEEQLASGEYVFGEINKHGIVLYEQL